MKKLVTLSAIALAGATLGVGTTFGWWADDAEEKKTKTEAVGDFVIQLSSDKFAPEIDGAPAKDNLSQIVAGALVIESETDGKPQKDVPAVVRFIHKNVNPSTLEKLADELEQEAKEFEGHGQKELAKIQRKLAQRLRAAMNASPPQVKIYKEPADAKPKQPKSEGEPAAEDVKRKLGVLRLELKGRDGEPKKNPEAYAQELKARIQEIEANPKAHENAEAQLDKLKAALEQQARAASQKDSAQLEKGRHLDQVVAHLKETAEKLEQAGRKDEARHIREHAEQVVRGAKEDHQPKFEKHDIIVEDGQKIIRLRRESKDGKGEQELAIIQADPKGPRKVISKELHEKGDLPAHIKVEGIRHVEAAPLFEVQRTLKELHHEIQELREEVRGLRGLLGAETARSGKQKARDDEDDQRDDEDKAEKTITKEYKARFRNTVKGEGEGEKREGEKKPATEKRDDDDDDDAKSDKREEKDDDDKKSDDREEEDESAQAKPVFHFYTGFLR